MLWLKRLFIRIKKKHIINLIAEFNNNDKSLCQIARLTDYICNISDSVQIISDLQAHPAGYRISFKLLRILPFDSLETIIRVLWLFRFAPIIIYWLLSFNY